MRAAIAAVIFFVASSAVASPKKQAKAGSYDDLFSAVDSASKANHSKPAHVAARSHSRSSKASAHKSAMVAAAAPRAAAPTPKADPDQLVLSDYAPNRHAWVGP